MPNPIIEPGSVLAKARAGMGIEEGDESDLQTPDDVEKSPEEVEAEAKAKAEETAKAKTAEEAAAKAKTEEEAKAKAKTEEEEKEKLKSPSDSDEKAMRPLKAVFTQLKEITDRLEKMESKSPEVKEAAKVADDAFKAFAEKIGADPAAITELYGVFQKNLLADLDKQGLLKKDLPADVQDKLKKLDELVAKDATQQVKEREAREAAHYEKEWTDLIPSLKQQFPFAGATEYSEAKKLMDTLSHDPVQGGVVIDEKNKILKPYTLDYILFKNKDKFSAILKVASNKKSGEKGGREMVDVDDEEEVDLDPSAMTPEKFKRYEAKKAKAAHSNKEE